MLSGFIARTYCAHAFAAPNDPDTVLGIAGAYIATSVRTSGGIGSDADFIGATIGALVVLYVWNTGWSSIISDPSDPSASSLIAD